MKQKKLNNEFKKVVRDRYSEGKENEAPFMIYWTVLIGLQRTGSFKISKKLKKKRKGP